MLDVIGKEVLINNRGFNILIDGKEGIVVGNFLTCDDFLVTIPDSSDPNYEWLAFEDHIICGIFWNDKLEAEKDLDRLLAGGQ